tara:strand:- start:1340 stop:1669 length:330 start_codon:yes stop_codon:yes gene_type:complete
MNLQKIALIVTIIGLISLFFVSEGINTPLVTHLEGSFEDVTVEGEIIRLADKDNVKFLEIDGCKQERLDLVVFSDEDIYVQEGDYISASGSIEEYKGKKELIVDELIVK